MPQVLTTNAIVLCPHLGKGTSIPTIPKWSVNGGVVLLENDTGILACPNFLYPCIGYRLNSMRLNAITIDGRRAILATDFNQTFTGLPLSIVETHQVVDNSTPVPIPAGFPAPPLSPALLDMALPTVGAAPTLLAFDSTSMQPPVWLVTFTLFSAFPLKWILTRLSLTQGTHSDLTDGLPSRADVTPSGGQWNSSSLTVTLRMTATYMAGLGKGSHEFYMTGVSQRGLSHYQKALLTVS